MAKTIKQSKNVKKTFLFAVGRRREAVARVRLYDQNSGKVKLFDQEFQKGDVVVNGQPFASYFNFFGYAPFLKEFFELTNTKGKFLYSIKVVGGGKKGQLDAILHGMARVLDKKDKEAHHKLLKDKGYLTRDPRTRERRKVGMGGKARRKKQSPKR